MTQRARPLRALKLDYSSCIQRGRRPLYRMARGLSCPVVEIAAEYSDARRRWQGPALCHARAYRFRGTLGTGGVRRIRALQCVIHRSEIGCISGKWPYVIETRGEGE